MSCYSEGTLKVAMRLSAYLFLAINLGDRGVVTLVRATSWKALNPVAKTSKKTGLCSNKSSLSETVCAERRNPKREGEASNESVLQTMAEPDACQDGGGLLECVWSSYLCPLSKVEPQLLRPATTSLVAQAGLEAPPNIQGIGGYQNCGGAGPSKEWYSTRFMDVTKARVVGVKSVEVTEGEILEEGGESRNRGEDIHSQVNLCRMTHAAQPLEGQAYARLERHPSRCGSLNGLHIGGGASLGEGRVLEEGSLQRQSKNPDWVLDWSRSTGKEAGIDFLC
ncbi:hypothetical protein Pmani_007301 [Petrolisthes manimaculis]|uniref:Uncharacterized protein n=1 Tax=Petrolisthes manimaculis TaxID=1843537 RepID=A0AAE1UKW8_9EUCA|nr:hypothetical protein Pmani_007301 [Petrolisthes manimaculis]